MWSPATATVSPRFTSASTLNVSLHMPCLRCLRAARGGTAAEAELWRARVEMAGGGSGGWPAALVASAAVAAAPAPAPEPSLVSAMADMVAHCGSRWGRGSGGRASYATPQASVQLALKPAAAP